MTSPEAFGGDYGVEVYSDPEVEKLLEFLAIYQKIQIIMSWLIEASANADPLITGVRRGQLILLMQQIGLDPEDPDAFERLEQMKAGLSDRALHPEPKLEVPEVGFFKSRIVELISEQEQYGHPKPVAFAIEGISDLVDVANYGYTDWSTLHSRDYRKPISEWIHGLARIMADPVAYQAQFAGLGISSTLRYPDHIKINEDWSVQNGRHRTMVARSLGYEYIREAGMAQWIPVEVEQ